MNICKVWKLFHLAAFGAAMSLGPATSAAPGFANGADVSWVDQQEAAGQVFRDSAGVATDPFLLLKHLQVDSIRLRVWVNPVVGWNNGADVLDKAQRAQAQGQRILIDFHYSDSWANPGQQTKLAAWANWWKSQASPGWQGYTMDALDASGKFTIALDPF